MNGNATNNNNFKGSLLNVMYLKASNLCYLMFPQLRKMLFIVLK